MSFKVKARVKVEYDAAGAFALSRHGKQPHGCLTIEDHLRCVVDNVRTHYDPHQNISDLDEVIAAAWLHDICEDTDTTSFEIAERFGERVGAIVELLTDKDGRNRIERHLRTYHAIRKDPDAILIKLCDRLHNQHRSIKHGEHWAAMYLKEFNYFKFSFWKPGQFVALWSQLDEQYEEMQRMLSW